MTRSTCGYCEASVLLSAQGNGSIRLQLLSVQHWPGQLLPSQPTTLITGTLSPPHWGDLDVQIDTLLDREQYRAKYPHAVWIDMVSGQQQCECLGVCAGHH